MEKPVENDLGVTEQAHEWFHALRQGSTQERARFASWLKASPRHVGEFLSVTAIYRQFDQVDPGRAIDVDQLLAEAMPSIVPFDQRSKSLASGDSSVKRRTRWRLTALAASVAAVALATGWLLHANFLLGRVYESAVGEVRAFELTDGSVIHLNTRSKVRVRLTDHGRDIKLLAGEALFTVARDPQRPFRVQAGEATVEAVGTQFSVYRRRQGTTVAVLEGAVRVQSENMFAPTLLSSGQGARIKPDGHIESPLSMDLAKATAWRQHRLIFRGDTLEEIAAEFNRYNTTPQFRVEGQAAAALRFTGVFDTKGPESLVRVLEGVESVAVERRGDEVVIRALHPEP